MQDPSASFQTTQHREPWNKGKLIGAKPPLRSKHVWSIRPNVQVGGRVRNLALFNLAIDIKLRGCDCTPRAFQRDGRNEPQRARPHRDEIRAGANEAHGVGSKRLAIVWLRRRNAYLTPPENRAKNSKLVIC